MNNKTMLSQILNSWNNQDFQNLLKLHKNALDDELILEIDNLIPKINIDDFISQQQIMVLLNYIYSDLKDNNLSEIDKYLLELKEHLSKLVK